MAYVDLNMDAEAEAERERLERERLARRAATQAQAAEARESAGYGDAALQRALTGLQQAPEAAAPPAAPAPTLPFQRTEADTRALQGGPEGMARPAVPAAPSAPMTAPAVAAGRDPGMAREAVVARPPAAPPAMPTPPAARPAAPPPVRKPEAAGGAAASSRLDAGLPTDRDISDAGTRDDIRRPFRALGRALQAAAGRSPGAPATAEADTLRQRRDAGMQQRMAGKSAARTEERQARQDGLQAERARMTDERERGTLDLQRTREERTGRIAEARLRLQEATSEQERREAMLELQRNDPQSAESERARRRYVASAMARERALGSSGRSAIDVETEVRDLAATDIEAMEGELASMTVGTRTSRAGGGAGRVPGQRPGVAVVGDVRLGDLIETGRMTEEQAAQLRADLESSNPRVRAEAQRQLATLMPGQGETRDIMPGLSVDLDIPNSEATSLRRQFGDASASWSTLGRVRGLAQQFGPSAVLNPEAIRRIETEMVPLRAMVARIQNTGVINPGERPLIDAVLPDPTSFSGQALGTFTAALDQWERQALAEMDARWLPYVREERADEVRRALRQRLAAGRGGGQQQQAPAAASTGGAQYQVTNPEGRTITRTLTPEQLRTLRGSRGYTVTEVR
jgi:hypothetical protein